MRGLLDAPQHNGKCGVVSSHDEVSGRYTVVKADGGVLSIKLANLLQRTLHVSASRSGSAILVPRLMI